MGVFEVLELLLAVWEKQRQVMRTRTKAWRKVVLKSSHPRKSQELSYTIELYKVIYSS